MRVLVCGGRDYGHLRPLNRPDITKKRREREHVSTVLTALSRPDAANMLGTVPIVIISGMATGADTVAVDWAVANWSQWEEFPAVWDDLEAPGAVIRTRRDGTKFNARAGFDRNQRMIDEGNPDLVMAFPGGSGTADMVRRATAAGIKIIDYRDHSESGVSHGRES